MLKKITGYFTEVIENEAHKNICVFLLKALFLFVSIVVIFYVDEINDLLSEMFLNSQMKHVVSGLIAGIILFIILITVCLNNLTTAYLNYLEVKMDNYTKSFEELKNKLPKVSVSYLEKQKLVDKQISKTGMMLEELESQSLFFKSLMGAISASLFPLLLSSIVVTKASTNEELFIPSIIVVEFILLAIITQLVKIIGEIGKRKFQLNRYLKDNEQFLDRLANTPFQDQV